MKKEYQLTEDEFGEIKAISQDREPVMKFGNYWSGSGPQDRANAFWKLLADKYGFVWDSAEPVPGKDHTFFRATPTNKMLQHE
jgi:hypothetical protein